MAPPPFKIVGDFPSRSPVAETAKTFRVSPRAAEQIEAALRAMTRDRKGAKAAKRSPVAKATKAATSPNHSRPRTMSPRKTGKASKTAARSSR